LIAGFDHVAIAVRDLAATPAGPTPSVALARNSSPIEGEQGACVIPLGSNPL
jgi:hypothetical protein